MYTKSWLVIKDDAKHTYEVCGQESNTNSFTNKTYAMQRDGMNVSCVLLPVTNRFASKGHITITGYTLEEGLYQRLLEHHKQIMHSHYKQLDDLDL